ncbi:hypothetical protein F3Y22_tig00110893pilonHSYRG00048 [Hibiscus syriacus]|uniref:Uncharacterized protein n=1 Tax=Hibiscus syriacus TaxID=106335 RepID=A0A6A2ZFX6_HIBSY|nr:hypothetical protein F3Y22_tig00110893pilonHSYRG00048 [Hibiscus syriacus]
MSFFDAIAPLDCGAEATLEDRERVDQLHSNSRQLMRKCASQPIVVPIIAEINLYKFDPWHLPDMVLYGVKFAPKFNFER